MRKVRLQCDIPKVTNLGNVLSNFSVCLYTTAPFKALREPFKLTVNVLLSSKKTILVTTIFQISHLFKYPLALSEYQNERGHREMFIQK